MSGQKDIRSSIVEGPDAYQTCKASLPLVARLYKKGKFQDGPDPKDIKKIRGKCERVPDELKIAMD